MKLHLTISLLLFAILPLRAAETKTPEALAEQQLAAMRSGDWAGYASGMHPKALDRLKNMLLPIFVAAEGAVADPSAAQVSTLLFGGVSAADAKAMPPAKFFETLMTSKAKLPGMSEAMQSAEGKVLGKVMEGEKAAHVVTRIKMNIPGLVDYTKMEIVSFEKDGDQWKGLLSGDMEIKMNQLMEKINASKGAPKNPAAK